MIEAIELYLITNNNGVEAVNFYKEVFKADIISMTTFGEAIPETLEEDKNLLLNADLKINGIRLQISDNGREQPYIQGTNMTACIQVENVDAATEIYHKLSQDALEIQLELQEMPWSPAYGIVVDKFGMTWQINTNVTGFSSEKVKFYGGSMFTENHSLMLYVDDVALEKAFWQAIGFEILSTTELMGYESFEMRSNPRSTLTIMVYDKQFIMQVSPEVVDNIPSVLFESNDIHALHDKIGGHTDIIGDIEEHPFPNFNFASPSGHYFAVKGI